MINDQIYELKNENIAKDEIHEMSKVQESQLRRCFKIIANLLILANFKKPK